MREIKKIILTSNSKAAKIVKGRKEYTCEWCGEVVLKGEGHYHYQNVNYWDANYYRFHKECYEYALLEGKNFIFGFKTRKNKKIEKDELENKDQEPNKYKCCFWEAMQVPDQRDSIPVKREVEIIAVNKNKAKIRCRELYKVAQFICVVNVLFTKKEKVVYKLENKQLKKRLRLVMRG